MNPQQPLPMAGITGEWIGFFQRSIVLLTDIGTDKISAKAITAFEERIEKIQERLERHSA